MEVPPLQGSVFGREEGVEAPVGSFLSAPRASFRNPFLSDNRKSQTLVAGAPGQKGANSNIVRDARPRQGTECSPKKQPPGYMATAREDIYVDTARRVPVSSVPETVLRFEACYTEPVSESSIEAFQLRVVHMLYFTEDDTLQVRVRSERNDGIPGGNILRRQRVPDLDVSSLNVGYDIEVYGRVYHITNCDRRTKEYIESVLGGEVAQPEYLPETAQQTIRHRLEEMKAVRPRDVPFNDKFVKFMKNDRVVLQFFGTWDERTKRAGELHFLVIRYFLANDSLEISEESRKGKKSTFLHRQMVPRDMYNPSLGMIDLDDLRIGDSLVVLGREVRIHDCDEYTRGKLLEAGRTEEEMEAVPYDVLEIEKAPAVVKPMPPWNGFGTEEDTMRNVKNIRSQPQKDHLKFLKYGAMSLNFTAEWRKEQVHAFDRDREFIIRYFPADDTFSILEKRLEGGYGGTFLSRTLVSRPGSRTIPFIHEDLYIGSEFVAYGRKFIITGTDAATKLFLEKEVHEKTEEMEQKVVKGIREQMRKSVWRVRNHFSNELSEAKSIDELWEELYRYHIDMSMMEKRVFARRYDPNFTGVPDYKKFVEECVGNVESSPRKERGEAALRDTLKRKAFLDSLKLIRDLLVYNGEPFEDRLKHLDTKRARSLPVTDIQLALTEQGVDLSVEDITSVASHLGYNNPQAIPFTHFYESVLQHDAAP